MHEMAFAIPYSSSFLSLLLFSLLLLSSTNAQTYKNISLGSSFTTQDKNPFWVSPSGEFAFGFQNVEPDGFLLAIWFDKIPDKTIVWSANRNNLVREGSKVEFTADGQLILQDSNGETKWKANILAGARVSYAAMLDTGNFVVASSDSAHEWESFDEPTDTILPMQTFVRGDTLLARHTAVNYSTGRFLFTLRADGNLVLYKTLLNSEVAGTPYWSTGTKGYGDQVIINQTGSMYLTASNGSILQMLFTSNLSTTNFYQRATLDYDGVFRYYVYPKLRHARQPETWSSLPNVMPLNICVNLKEDLGSGACGLNSYCAYDLGENIPTCHCPNGYSFFNADDVQRGCKRDFSPQDCGEETSEIDLFDFVEIESSDWVGNDFEYLIKDSEDTCKQACLADCFCAAIVYKSPNCFKKRYPLSNGLKDPSVLTKSFVKISKEITTLRTGGGESKKNNDSSPSLILIGSILLGSSVLLNFLFTFFAVVRSTNRETNTKAADQHQGMNLQRFPYEKLNKVTNGFKETLGRGAAGTVFKGILTLDGMEKHVAVKRLDNMVTKNDAEFQAEVNAIGRTNHRNVVQLLGFCNEAQHRLLVYELMTNGSLESFLFGESRLNWNRRMQIALGTARGLLYLHEECSNSIIHCDIKPQNILLDDSFTARISDFGLAKILKIDRIQTTTAIRGTKGYVAPEWFRHMPVTGKVDVYSYGILLLELVCGRKNFEAEAEDQNRMVLADWAYDCYSETKLHLLVENDEEAMNDMKRVEKYVMTAIWCIQEDPSLRPTMREVIKILEGTLGVSPPPDPSS
ncbi:hypothetical protein TIFTF001_001336 [Ficus carica]|uniref:Receptor-like serine/threonine-protein kinase n=1 Tax=Ficus carica TaxID=3494 RepID=A0AA88CQY1_FICCA|nr:hypothetical protein TIFTF001_001336 [Ficus carica]